MPLDQRLRALNGFGLGARAGERSRMGDPKAWLRAQLAGDPPLLRAPEGAGADELAAALRASRMRAQGSEVERRQARQRLVQIAAAESRAAFTQRVRSERPFVERLVAFWSNHVCVSARAKQLVAPLAGSYEREVVRPHVLGRFEEMVLASAKHPAMLFYLDNFQSIGPNSAAVRLAGRAGAARGLNENYARELLELHTLGVEGGYAQQDVIELARLLTGWTVAGIAGPGVPRRLLSQGDTDGPIRFVFRELLHEPGAKTVLGIRYEGGGVAAGERAIRALCRHPSTAGFVAGKLVRHFVSDQPPPSAVDRISRAFQESEGDLKVVAEALVDLPEAWTEGARKFRTPQDWVVAVVRAFNSPDVRADLTQVLRQLRHPLWSPQAPNGFGDTTQEWADPDSLLNRAELARTVARRIPERAIDPRILLDVMAVESTDPLRTLLSDNSIPVDERVALAIAGPAFQWR